MLTALFTGACGLAKQLKEVVDVLEDQQENARNQMSQKTMAAIMWIIQLQARTFFCMEKNADGTDKVQDDFTRMMHDL